MKDADNRAYSPARSMPDGLRSVGNVELTRRKFTSNVARLGVLVAGISGALVGFAPSAQALINCVPGSKARLAGAGSCNESCIGPCARYFSQCTYNSKTGHKFTCQCNYYCVYKAKAVVKCMSSGSYGCCVEC